MINGMMESSEPTTTYSWRLPAIAFWLFQVERPRVTG